MVDGMLSMEEDIDLSLVVQKYEKRCIDAKEEDDAIKNLLQFLLSTPYLLEVFSIIFVALIFFAFSISWKKKEHTEEAEEKPLIEEKPKTVEPAKTEEPSKAEEKSKED